MPECDKEAVLIFLRNTAFGTDYTIKLTDPKTKEEFSHTFDLSILKTKDIGVEIDGNNEFEFFLDISKKKVKLSFITPTDDKELKEIDKANKNNIVNPYMTKQLEKIVKEVDGVRDAMTIAQFIQTMPIRDSQNIRKVIRENTPAIDLNIIVNSPSNTEVGVRIAFGVEFFRPFYGI